MAPPRAGSATLRWTAMVVATIASLSLVALGVNLGSGMLGLRDERAAREAARATAAVVDVDASATPAISPQDADASAAPLPASTNIAAAFFAGLPLPDGAADPGTGGSGDTDAPPPAPPPGPVTPPGAPSDPSLDPVLAPLAPILDPLPLDQDEASVDETPPSAGGLVAKLAAVLGL